MSRRSRPANRFGCKPDGDVCLAHDMPLVDRLYCGGAMQAVIEDYRFRTINVLHAYRNTLTGTQHTQAASTIEHCIRLIEELP